jgi:hypothetical protein
MTITDNSNKSNATTPDTIDCLLKQSVSDTGSQTIRDRIPQNGIKIIIALPSSTE